MTFVAKLGSISVYVGETTEQNQRRRQKTIKRSRAAVKMQSLKTFSDDVSNFLKRLPFVRSFYLDLKSIKKLSKIFSGVGETNICLLDTIFMISKPLSALS